MEANVKRASFLVLALAVFAGCNNAKPDSELIQGEWEMTGGERGGKPAPDDAIKDVKFVFTAKTLTIKGRKEDPEQVNDYKIDSTKSPKEIDVEPSTKTSETSGGGKIEHKSEGMKGIYSLDGDTLKICFDKEDKDSKRPTEIATKDGSGVTILILKRVKK
jgi:uncharacterized protein (TIGR03067 family)